MNNARILYNIIDKTINFRNDHIIETSDSDQKELKIKLSLLNYIEILQKNIDVINYHLNNFEKINDIDQDYIYYKCDSQLEGEIIYESIEKDTQNILYPNFENMISEDQLENYREKVEKVCKLINHDSAKETYSKINKKILLKK